MNAMVAASLPPLRGPLHTHPRIRCATTRTLARFCTPAGPLQPRQLLLLALVAGESPPLRTLQFWSWSRCAHAICSADLPLYHKETASSVVRAATILPRGLGIKCQVPLLFCRVFFILFLSGSLGLLV